MNHNLLRTTLIAAAGILLAGCQSPSNTAGTAPESVQAAPADTSAWTTLPDGSLGRRAEFDGVGGVKIAAYIRKPAGPGPFPMVLLLHGNTSFAKRVTEGTDQERAEKAQAEADHASDQMGHASNPPIRDFLAQGWAVYYVDYRPSDPNYKIEPVEFDDTVIAYKKALKWSFVDPKRIAVVGGSHGGHVTGRMTTRVKLCCAILCAPAGLDLIELSHLEAKGVKIGANHSLIAEMEQRSGVKMAEIEKNPGKYHYNSLLTEVPKVRCPIFLISGVNDPNAPIALMDEYLDALRKAGKEVAPPYHPANGPHGFYVGLPHHIPETDEATRQEVYFLKEQFDKAAAAETTK